MPTYQQNVLSWLMSSSLFCARTRRVYGLSGKQHLAGWIFGVIINTGCCHPKQVTCNTIVLHSRALAVLSSWAHAPLQETLGICSAVHSPARQHVHSTVSCNFPCLELHVRLCIVHSVMYHITTVHGELRLIMMQNTNTT